MTRSRQWVVLSLFLLALGSLIIAFKAVRLGYPLLPDQTSEEWTIQARLEIEPTGGPVRASLMLPVRSTGFTVSDENFISRGFGLTIEEELFRRQADWAIRSLSGTKALYYRATVISATRDRRFANTPDIPQVPIGRCRIICGGSPGSPGAGCRRRDDRAVPDRCGLFARPGQAGENAACRRPDSGAYGTWNHAAG
jgi:hypothetical protein